MHSQTSEYIPDLSPNFIQSAATQTHSFYDFLSDSDISPVNLSMSESGSSQQMDERKFRKFAVTRLKKNEFVENGKFLCNNAECQQTFDDNRKRNNHLRKHDKPFQCSWPGCQSKSSWERDIIRHYDTHNSKHVIPCPQCVEKFTRRYNLKRHVDEAHGGKKRIKKS